MIEPISSILGNADSNYLQRIYLATKLQKHLKKTYEETARVIVRNKVITLSCYSAAQASFFRLKRRHLYGELASILGKGHGYKIVVRVKSY